MATYAYARTSSESPSLSAQEAELRKAGANITFADENHVGATRRGELAKALKLLKAGDVLLVARLEHLAGSISELLDIVHVVGKAGAGLKQPQLGYITSLEFDCLTRVQIADGLSRVLLLLSEPLKGGLVRHA